MRARDIQPRKLVIFDIDDTLVHTQTKVHVVKDGQVTHSLNSHEFTHYKLQPGESFDFGDFRNARDFFENSKPIIPMINQLKKDIATGNKVVMVTARADFNDRELFLDTFRKYGVDMSKVHVYRAGNMHIKAQTEEKKKIIIRDLLGKELYDKAIMYDDAEPNLHAFISLKNEYPHTKFYAIHVSLDGVASEYHRTDESCWKGYKQIGMKKKGKRKVPNCVPLKEDQSDYEIRNYHKLDKILVELCNEIIEGQKTDPDMYGMVASCVLDLDQNRTTSTSTKDGDKWKHAERNAIDAYNEIYGDIPEGSIIITTLSPCSEHMHDRYGESCTDLINQSTVKKVYSGYTDPTQKEEDREFNIMETENSSIRDLCKRFADTFLGK